MENLTALSLIAELDATLFGAVFILGTLAAFAVVQARRARATAGHLDTALNNMLEGLCMFDGQQRLVLWNRRYAEIYDLQHERLRAGMTLGEVVDMRVQAKTSPRMTKDEYLTWRSSVSVRATASETTVELMNGRIVSIRHRPMPENGWVATHEDITDRLEADRSRARMAERDEHRLVMEQAIGGFRSSVADVLASFDESLAAMNVSAATLCVAAEGASKRAGSALAASGDAVRGVQGAAAANAQLTGSIADMGARVTQTADLVATAVGDATIANTEILGLADAASQIGSIVMTIAGIAERTNLLALNATIEAARAGQSGRGFAVVAAEVKSLAVQTRAATTRIAGQIDTLKHATASAVDATLRNTGCMTGIGGQTERVSGLIREQEDATQAIAENVACFSGATVTISDALGDVEEAVGETRLSAEAVVRASTSVGRAAVELREQVEHFLSRVAA